MERNTEEGGIKDAERVREERERCDDDRSKENIKCVQTERVCLCE